jgi:hypothetical protein
VDSGHFLGRSFLGMAFRLLWFVGSFFDFFDFWSFVVLLAIFSINFLEVWRSPEFIP